MAERISSQDKAYIPGDLSVYPFALDDKSLLYTATNNAKVALKHSLSYNGNIIVVEPNTDGFPNSGILRIGPDIGLPGQFELVYYDKKTGSTFQNLQRGFCGTKRNGWSTTGIYVSNAVVADHHNAPRDALLNIEKNLGVKTNADSSSLNGILTAQEARFLAPRPLFRGFPLNGPAPLTVRFQNFTTGYIIRYLWDFGDGSTSTEKSPIYTYQNEGSYTVKLNIVTNTGAQGVQTKINYIQVNPNDVIPFFYVESVSNPYSVATAEKLNTEAKSFLFVDQTDGDIVQRNWIFDDGEQVTEADPDVHTIQHTFKKPGTYNVGLLVIFNDGLLKRASLPQPLVVL